MHRAPTFCLVLSAALLVTLLAGSWIMAPQLVRADDSAAGTKLVPVETNMHEFMEYVFQPTYRRLKPAMDSSHAAEPAWKTIKSDSLILAETSNLLLLHTPPKDPGKWNETSVAVRDAASQLYKFARQRDFAASRKTYEQMLTSCNACHKQFAGGKHMLSP